MEKSDYLRIGDEVTVEILGPANDILYKGSSKDYHSIESAISSAIENANLSENPENCVFNVTNQTTGVSHKYRINAHGNLKLIV